MRSVELVSLVNKWKTQLMEIGHYLPALEKGFIEICREDAYVRGDVESVSDDKDISSGESVSDADLLELANSLCSFSDSWSEAAL